jgi:hypothetical protein
MVAAAARRCASKAGWASPIESRSTRRQRTPALVCAGAAPALGFVWGLVRGNSAGWGSTEVVVALAAGTTFTLAFVLAELRAPSPMLPMRLFR